VVNQCLRCKGPCETTVNFCEDCRALLQRQFQHNDESAHSILLHHTGKATAVASKSNDVESIPTTPSASIQDATSIPQNEDDLTELPTMPVSGAMNDLPIEDADLNQAEESEPVEQSDPLLARHLPDSTEAALIEEHDMRLAAIQGKTGTKDTKTSTHPQGPAASRPTILFSGKIPRRLRIALIAFIFVAALALILDGILVFLDVTRHPLNIIVSKPVSTLAQTPGTGQTKVSSSPVTTGGQPSSSGSPVPGMTPFGPSQTPGTGTPLSSSAMLSILPLGFQFTATQGQSNPPGQQISIGNTGNSPFYWQASINSSSSPWLSITPVDGAVPAGQSISALVNVNAAGLTPGTYDGQITVTATDASGMQVQGSPQTALVTLSVLQPCTLQEAPASLSFTVSLLQPNAPGQNISFKEVGNCSRPVSWTASVDASSRSWLMLSATSGSDKGNGNTIVVNVNAQGKQLGRYTGRITLAATDSNGGTIQNSPQYIAVTLNVIV
jgi:hypothetical protein